MTNGGPPLINEDWYSLCQVLYDDIHADEWSKMKYEYKGLRQKLGVVSTGRGERVKVLWRLYELKAGEAKFLDDRVEDMVKSRRRIRREMWDAHITDPWKMKKENQAW